MTSALMFDFWRQNSKLAIYYKNSEHVFLTKNVNYHVIWTLKCGQIWSWFLEDLDPDIMLWKCAIMKKIDFSIEKCFDFGELNINT